MTTAMPMTSLKPRMNTAPRTNNKPSVTRMGWCIQPGTRGFSMRWAVASAADSVIVMTKLVAANPSRTRTTAFPFQRGNNDSSIRMLPCPCGLASATR